MSFPANPVDDAGPPVDLIVVGGGINGAGIARDAAGRGLSVMLVEQDDLASHTSSASSKLIHGGLRYLEHGEFALVRKALAEREVLLRAAPHLVRLQQFVLPLVPGMRPAWVIRAGLFLYDKLAQRERVPGSTALDLRRHAAGVPLRSGLERGFASFDALTKDAQTVVANAVDCAERGGVVLTRTRCESALREQGHWLARLTGSAGHRYGVRARALVNASGPWAASFLTQQLRRSGGHVMRLVRGSHIVVPALYAHRYAYILQQPDRRVVFAIPYQGGHTLIGTTEVEHRGDPARAAASAEEIAYLCAAANRRFAREISPRDVVWHFSGVRPLFDDEDTAASSVSRGYALELDDEGAPLLSVFGGKLTTHRVLAEEALDRLAPLLGCRAGSWTRQASLPGGDMPDADFEAYAREAARAFPWLPEPLLTRWLGAYGTRLTQLVGEATAIDALGEELLPGLYEAELHHLAGREWARSGEDVLWRRSKLGLALSPAERARGAARIDRALAALRI